MSVHVNLLKDDEIRYYSAVSRSFAIRTGSIGLALFLTLLSLLFILRVVSVKAGLKSCQADWEEVEPRYTRFKDLQANLRVNEGLMKELEEWNNMKVKWDEPLLRVQMLVPETIQVTTLDLRSTFSAKVDRTKIGEGDDATEIVKITPSRAYRMTLRGLAEGDLADETVVQFVRALRSDDQLNQLWEGVKLQGLQRGSAQDEGSRVFTLEALSVNMKGVK